MPFLSVLSLILLSGVIFYQFIIEGSSFSNSSITKIFFFFSILFIWSTFGLIYHGESFEFGRTLAFIIMIYSGLAATLLVKKVSLEKLLKYYLIVHASFFFLQFFVYYITGYVIDFLAMIPERSQSMSIGSFSLPVINRFIRPAGLFNEPGTYSVFIAPMLALFGRWYTRSSINKKVFWISLSTLVLSFSVFGLIFTFLIFLFSKHIKYSLRIVSSVIGGIAVSPYLYYRFVLRPQVGLGTGVEIRGNFLSESINFLTSSMGNFLFGASLLSTDGKITFSKALNDSGMFLYLNHFIGPLFLTCIIFGLIWVLYKSDVYSKVAILILLLSKVSLFAPFLSFMIIFILYKKPLLSVK